ncbi:MAG: hypothetical protein ACO3RW_00995 [Burkholderiaceae bacterium]
MTFEIAMTVDQSHPTLTQRLVCQGVLLALFAGLPLVAQAQLGPTTLRALEAQAGIPDGSPPIAQSAPAPVTPSPATSAAQAANVAAAPTPAQAGGAATPPPPLKPEPIDWANFKAPQSDEERRLEAAKAKKIADMRALLGTNAAPAKAAAKAPAPQKQAKDAETTPYDTQLAAIRDALIEKALQGPTRVVSTAWIDDQGRLHEDAQMTNDMRVRGVRVLNYTANGKATIKADVDMQAPNQPICAAPDAAKWTQHVRVMSQISPDVRPEDLHFANEMLAGWLTEWARASQTYARRWQQSPMNVAERDAYEQALLGRTAGGRPDQGQWRLLMTIARAEEGSETVAAPAPQFALFGAPPDTGISRHWQLTLRLEPMFSNATPLVQQAKLTWTMPEATLIPPKLPENVAVGLAWESEKWIKAINERMACEPLQFAMKEKMGGEVHINGGRFNGLEVGDRLVMVDSRALPARMLHAGVAARLALAEVAQVDETESVLRQVAGPPLPEKPQGDWVAMPY